MKHLKLTFLLAVLMSMVGAKVYAYDAKIDGIYYNFSGSEANVTHSSSRVSVNTYNMNAYTGSVVIPESVTYNGKIYSVTTIESYAFIGCWSLTSVTIPNSVTSIGNYAFHYCYGLTSVYISDLSAWCNIAFSSPFYNAYHLFLNGEEIKDLVIPNSVTSIGNYAFHYCSFLTSVTIPNSVTSIGNGAFGWCSDLTSIIVDARNTVYDSRDNCNAIIETASNTLITGCKNTIIPNSVTTIESYAFSGCTGLTSVTIPNSMTSIGEYTFSGCTGLTSITIPNSVTTIGDKAFSECTGLTSVTIPNSVTTIGDKAFYDCTGLKNITIPNSVTTIGGSAFCGCTGLTSITIPNSVTSIGNNAFSSSSPRKVIWLTNTPPEGYTNAGGTVNYVANDLYSNLSNKTVYPFLSSIFEVDGVKYVPVSPSERTCDAIDCAYNESAEKINIGKTVSYKGIDMTVKNVNKYVCYGNSFIKDVDLSFEGDLNDYAFQNCTAMKTATLGEGITSIGQYAFDGCKQLQSIVIPDAVTSLGNYAFQNCTSMTSAKIGKGVTTIKQYVFAGCSSMTDMTIGSNVTNIASYAFFNCSALPKIVIPQSVTDIQNYTFSGCNSLKEVIMADRKTDDKALTLGSNGSNPLFADCPLDSVYIGRNISYSTSSSYGYSPFYRNTSLHSVTITDKETEISPNEFYGCTNLKNVSIGNGVESIGDWAFSGCGSLDYFAFGSSMKTIGKEAFSDCTAMTRLISRAVTPPTCGSQALDDINKWNCTLSVPKGSTSAYQQAPQWKDFFFIDNEINGINVLMNSKAVPTHFYNLNGQKENQMMPGLNIIKMNDGTTKKVIIK